MRPFLLLLCACLTFAACDSSSNDETSKSPTGSKEQIVYADPGDTAMNRAVQEARRTLTDFEKVLASHDTSQYNFAVKVALPHPGGTEHIWLNKPELEQDSVVGTVESQPMYVKTVAAGQRVRISRDRVSDWMYMENGKLRGGYTMRIALESLPEKERATHKKALGID